LLEREVLDAIEVKLLMEGKPLPEKPRTPPTPPPQGAPSTDPKSFARSCGPHPVSPVAIRQPRLNASGNVVSRIWKFYLSNLRLNLP